MNAWLTTRVEKNLDFFKKTTHLVLFGLKKLFFLKKQDFVLFLRKTEKTHSELFLFHHAVSPFSDFTILTCYTYYGIQN